MNVRVAVVDGVGSGRWLTHELTDRGAECLHVKSRPALEPHLEASFRPDQYALDLGYDHDVGRLATRLVNLGVSWIAAGHASGVATAETLARLTGLPGDAPELAEARHDRQAMARRLYQAGLDAPLGARVTSAEEAVTWFTTADLGAAGAVVRPVGGAGAGRPVFCRTAAEVRAAAGALVGAAVGAAWSRVVGAGSGTGGLLGGGTHSGPGFDDVAFGNARLGEGPAAAGPLSTGGPLNAAGPLSPTGPLSPADRPARATMFGDSNQAVVIEEALVGSEYRVDTVSVDGVRLIVDTWCCVRQSSSSGAPLDDFSEPADPAAPEVAVIHGYVLRALEALGVRHGATHSRVVLTARGPILVDPGSGLADGVLPWVAEKFLGYSHAGLLAESIVQPRDALLRAGQLPEAWPEPIRHVSLVNRRPGAVRPSAHWAGALEALPTAIAVAAVAGAGMELPVTRNAATSPGFVYLSSSDRTQIERDYQTIRDWEQQGPYTV